MNEEGYIILDPSMVFGSNSSSSSLSEFGFKDMFTQTKLSVVSISVGGLDSSSSNGTSVLNPIGSYTLHNTFNFDRLPFALDMSAEIGPSSSKSESQPQQAVNVDTPMVVETFSIEITM